MKSSLNDHRKSGFFILSLVDDISMTYSPSHKEESFCFLELPRSQKLRQEAEIWHKFIQIG